MKCCQSIRKEYYFAPIENLANKQVEEAMNAALDAGYRHIDTAYMYCNEEVLGKVLKKWFDSGRIRREELFIVTKLAMTGMSPEKALYFLRKSLKNLQLDYVDLFLIHAPFGFHYVNDETLFPMKDGKFLFDHSTNLEAIRKSLEKEVDAGKVKSLGVSNFNSEQVERICKIAKHKPMKNQVELHGYLQQKSLVEACKKLGVTVCAFAPIGSAGRKLLYDSIGIKWEPNGLISDPVVEKIAKAKGKTPAQILLRFLTQQGIAVIPKSVSSERIKQNFQISDFDLSPQEFKALEALDKGEAGRTFTFDHLPGAETQREYPFKKN